MESISFYKSPTSSVTGKKKRFFKFIILFTVICITNEPFSEILCGYFMSLWTKLCVKLMNVSYFTLNIFFFLTYSSHRLCYLFHLNVVGVSFNLKIIFVYTYYTNLRGGKIFFFLLIINVPNTKRKYTSICYYTFYCEI